MEAEREGEIKEEGAGGEEEGGGRGFQAAYLHLYIINPRFSNQREEKKQTNKKKLPLNTLLNLSHIPQQHKH